jgi:hypothetical protein
LLAELEFVAGNAAEDDRDPLEGGLRLDDRDALAFFDDPRGPSVGRVVVGSGDRGITLAWSGLEPAGPDGYPQVQVSCCGVGDVYERLSHMDPPPSSFSPAS